MPDPGRERRNGPVAFGVGQYEARRALSGDHQRVQVRPVEHPRYTRVDIPGDHVTRRAQVVVLSALAVSPALAAGPASAEAAWRFPTPTGQPARAAPGWYELEVPGGAAALAEAAGLPSRTEPWRLVSQIARRVHAPYGEGRLFPRAVDRIAAHLDAVSGPGAPVPGGGTAARPVETIPLPLPPDTWHRALALTSPGNGALLRALVTDRAAALLYRGLLCLDAPTLASISDGHAIARIAARHAEVFALVAPAFRVRAGRVAAPGGGAEQAAWQAVVGAPLGDPPRFLLGLLGRDDGRLAMLYSDLAALDPLRQAWAMALDGTANERLDRLRRWQRLAASQPDWWRDAGGPFLRRDNDLTAALAAVSLAEGGRLAPSDRRGFWKAVFDGATREAEDARVADAPWLVEQVTGVDPGKGRQRLLALRFAQRVFGAAHESALPDVIRALHGLRAFPALAPILERLGVSDAALHAAAAARATGLSRGPASRLPDAVAPFQGVLALVDRAHRAGVLTTVDSQEAVRGLLAASAHDDADAVGLARWLDSALLPLLAARTGSVTGTPAEEIVVRALAGKRPAERLPEIHWEGLPYRVDIAGAEAARIGAVRRAQEAPNLDEALAACSPTASTRAARCRAPLAQALAALAYAAHLPAPVAGVSERTARRHQFGEAQAGAPTVASAAWSLPEAVSSPDSGWHLAGSLLGLDLALAQRRLSRADSVPPSSAPTLDPSDRQALAEAAALVEPAALDDTARDAMAAALERGHTRVAQALGDPSARELLVADLGVYPPALLDWAARRGPPTWSSLFTLADLLRLGEADLDALAAWGLPARRGSARLTPRLPTDPLDERALAGRPHQGALGEQVADLNLRIAEALSRKGLPARLAGPMLLRAAQDLIDEAEPAYAGDCRTVALAARDLSEHRIDDYVSALVGSVLVPVVE